MMTIKKAATLGLLASAAMVMATSCNNDWEDEQYAHYISFKAPLDTDGNSVGVTTVYVPFTRYNEAGEPRYGAEGKSSYQLPVLVSGSTDNPDNLTVNIAHSDTLPILNVARFGTREELYYQDLWDFAEVPQTINIASGQNMALLDVRFDFNGLDLSDRYVLPIVVAPGSGYQRNPRKNYGQAMLRILPYTTYSGVYQAQNTTFYILDKNDKKSGDPGAMNTVQCYTVSNDVVFFYAGNFDETSLLRKHYKVYAKFEPFEEGGTRGNVTLWSDTPEMEFVVNKQATFNIIEQADEVQTYIMRRTVIISDIDYTFVDTHTASFIGPDGQETVNPIKYNVSGSMAMERKLNTQMPEEDQVIFE